MIASEIVAAITPKVRERVPYATADVICWVVVETLDALIDGGLLADGGDTNQ